MNQSEKDVLHVVAIRATRTLTILQLFVSMHVDYKAEVAAFLHTPSVCE